MLLSLPSPAPLPAPLPSPPHASRLTLLVHSLPLPPNTSEQAESCGYIRAAAHDCSASGWCHTIYEIWIILDMGEVKKRETSPLVGGTGGVGVFLPSCARRRRRVAIGSWRSAGRGAEGLPSRQRVGYARVFVPLEGAVAMSWPLASIPLK